MSWIELHQDVAWKRKTYDLAKELGVRRAEALGLLVTLWLWAIEHAQDGQLGHLTHKEVSAVSGWHRSSELFVLALHKTRWLDSNGYLHDWHDFAGRLIEQREDDRDRKRADRQERRKVRGLSAGQSGG